MKCKTARGIALAVLIASAPVLGHHAFSSIFDINKVLTLKGNVTKVDWMNPHPYIYLDVKDAGGSSVNWSVEFSDLNKLRRVGLEKEMIEIGKEITIVAYAARADGDFVYLDAPNLPMSHAKTRRFARAKEVVFINSRQIEVP